jgi:hypothetical protein
VFSGPPALARATPSDVAEDSYPQTHQKGWPELSVRDGILGRGSGTFGLPGGVVPGALAGLAFGGPVGAIIGGIAGKALSDWSERIDRDITGGLAKGRKTDFMDAMANPDIAADYGKSAPGFGFGGLFGGRSSDYGSRRGGPYAGLTDALSGIFGMDPISPASPDRGALAGSMMLSAYWWATIGIWAHSQRHRPTLIESTLVCSVAADGATSEDFGGLGDALGGLIGGGDRDPYSNPRDPDGFEGRMSDWDGTVF